MITRINNNLKWFSWKLTWGYIKISISSGSCATILLLLVSGLDAQVGTVSWFGCLLLGMLFAGLIWPTTKVFEDK